MKTCLQFAFFLIVVIFITSLFPISLLYGQGNCNCDLMLPTNVKIIDGDDYDINPGDIICFKSGKYKSLLVKNFHGESGNRITFINCAGKAIFSRLRFENSQYFRLTGTGVEGVNYGIAIDGSISEGANGLSVSLFSTDFEVDHLEFMNTKAAAFHMVMRPGCDPMTQRGNFVIKNIDVHNNYVHEAGTEGFYFGHSKYYGVDIECDGKTKTAYPVLIENIKIHDNIFNNTGWDAMQVSTAEKLPGALIYNNRIYNYGTKNVVTQSAGIVIGGGSSAKVYNNWIEKGGTGGIHVFGLGGVYIFNNLIKDCGGAGVFIGDKGVNPKLGMHVNNNTILNVAETGITVNNEVSTGNTFYNNIIINPGNYKIFNNKANAFIYFKNNNWDYDSAGNYTHPKYNNICFQDPDNDNYYLTEKSPAKNTGVDLSDLGITFDYNFYPRDAKIGYSKGAFEFGSKPTVVTSTEDLASNNVNSITIFPSPLSKGDLTFEIEMIEGDTLNATLVNVSGSISIPIIQSQFLPIGHHSLTVPKEKIHLASKTNETYFVVFTITERSRVKSIHLVND